eukprot:3914301-Rhodomonas_salina.1
MHTWKSIPGSNVGTACHPVAVKPVQHTHPPFQISPNRSQTKLPPPHGYAATRRGSVRAL